MSLELAAQHLASRGRGPDTQLIHMAPQEVAGLHALAKAHGGALTTNPDTGLPEAGFLSKLLPTLIGFGLAPFTGGLSAALMVGAGYTAATGSLKKGLMAGLGAFGGAGLAGGLSAAGAAGTAAAEAGTGLSALDAGMGAFPSTGTIGAEALGAAAPAGNLGAAAVTPDLFGGTAGEMASAYGAPPGVMPPAPMAPPVAAPMAPTVAAPVATATPIPSPTITLPPPPAAPAPSPYTQMGRGLESLTTPEGRTAFMGNAASKGVEASGVGGTSGLLKSGMMAAAPIMFQEPEPFKKPYTGSVLDYTYEYDDANRTSPYRRVPKTQMAAGGGLMDIQPVEAMSQQNQAQMRPAYAQGGVSDMAVNPYTGSEAFAGGGQINLQGTIDMAGAGGGSNQYGGGFGGSFGSGSGANSGLGNQAAPSVMPSKNPFSGGMDAPANGFNGFDNRGAPMAREAFLARPELGSRGTEEQYNQYLTNYKKDDADRMARQAGLLTSGDPGQRQQAMETMLMGNRQQTGDRGLTQELRPGDPQYANYMNNRTPGGEKFAKFAEGGMAQNGIASLAQGGESHLGDYSDGGRLLRGPGDGVSDSIPASIGDKRPARLADGEFVVPARIVSELGNGSTEAGARKLYAMMDRVQKARAKTTGKDRVAANTKAERLMPA